MLRTLHRSLNLPAVFDFHLQTKSDIITPILFSLKKAGISMETLKKLFSDPDTLAELIADIDLSAYLNMIRTNRIASNDGSEEGGYFCAVPRHSFSSLGEAYPLLLLHDLYDSEEWDKSQLPFQIFDKNEWITALRTYWIPEYLAVGENKQVSFKTVTETQFYNDWLPIAGQLADDIKSPVQSIIRYGMIDAWNFSDYLVVTETEYIDFQYWTTA